MRVLVVDDSEGMRMGLRVLLNSQPDLECCGTACNGAQGIALARQTRPDVVLLDTNLSLSPPALKVFPTSLCDGVVGDDPDNKPGQGRCRPGAPRRRTLGKGQEPVQPQKGKDRGLPPC